MPSQNILNMIEAVRALHKPKTYSDWSSHSGHKEPPRGEILQGFDQHKGDSTEQAADREKVESEETQTISAISGETAMDQEKHPKVKADYLYKLTVGFLRKNGFFQGLVSGDISFTCGGVENGFSVTALTLNKDDRYVLVSYGIQQSNGQVQNISS